ncbi:MAG: histidinol-phosphatase [candidate division WOR-3 bacterium]|jgi:histidinol-phosphatase (PHP family)
MSWVNFHTHSNFDDGRVLIEEYIEEALKQDVAILGFSSHNPLPFSVDWVIKKEKFTEYCKTVRELAKKYEDKIRILLGLEMDFLSNLNSFYKEGVDLSLLDYIIGSIHFVNFFEDKSGWAIDGSQEDFVKGLNELYEGNTKKVVQDYYKLIRNMLKNENPDILGHIDLIKMHNKEEKYFSEKENWYRQEVTDTLKAVARSSSILEVNTGGIARGKIDSLYPSTWILEEAYQMRIPITLSSDAHKPEQITAKFKEAAVLLNSIGYKEIYIPHKKTWAPHPISVEGVEL